MAYRPRSPLFPDEDLRMLPRLYTELAPSLLRAIVGERVIVHVFVLGAVLLELGTG